jgi:hypothetical protein
MAIRNGAKEAKTKRTPRKPPEPPKYPAGKKSGSRWGQPGSGTPHYRLLKTQKYPDRYPPRGLSERTEIRKTLKKQDESFQRGATAVRKTRAYQPRAAKIPWKGSAAANAPTEDRMVGVGGRHGGAAADDPHKRLHTPNVAEIARILRKESPSYAKTETRRLKNLGTARSKFVRPMPKRGETTHPETVASRRERITKSRSRGARGVPEQRATRRRTARR